MEIRKRREGLWEEYGGHGLWSRLPRLWRGRQREERGESFKVGHSLPWNAAQLVFQAVLSPHQRAASFLALEGEGRRKEGCALTEKKRESEKKKDLARTFFSLLFSSSPFACLPAPLSSLFFPCSRAMGAVLSCARPPAEGGASKVRHFRAQK